MTAGDSTTTTDNLQQNPGIEQKRIIIQNNCGEKLVGLLHETGSKEIVILCHGFRDSKDYIMMVDLASALEKQGISAFRFDFSGNGESEGVFQFGNYHKEVADLKAVIQHFTAVELTVNRLVTAVLGHSMGGTVVVLYASLYHDIQTVVNVSGRYNMDSGLEGRLGKNYMERAKTDGFIDVKSKKGNVLYRVTEESLTEWMNINMYEVDQNCRVLTVHGSVDEVFPVEDALELAKILPNHELRIIEGANHGYSNCRGELASVVSAFVKANMHRV